MSQKLRFLIVGSELIKFGFKKPNSEFKSLYWGLEMPRRGYFASITFNWFIGGLLFKSACSTTDIQSVASLFLRYSVFIGQ